MKRLSFFVMVLLLMAGLALPVLAQDGENEDGVSAVTDDAVNEVAREIYCPVCESTPLDVCATQACADWRELIREQLGDGQTKNEIFDYFSRQYGDGVLANPPRRGVSLVILWVLPVVLVLVGLLLFGRFVLTLRNEKATAEPQLSGTAAAVPTKPASKDDYLTQVEEELRK